jgi:ADP-ribose pyrophosphatase
VEKELSNIYPLVPRVGVGAIVINDGKVLLIRRGIEPSLGMWSIPGGTLKLGEKLQECAAREMLEETGVTIEVGACAYVFDYLESDAEGKIKFHYIVIDYAAKYISGEAKGADDAAEAGWFKSEDLESLHVTKNTLAALKKIRFID